MISQHPRLLRLAIVVVEMMVVVTTVEWWQQRPVDDFGGKGRQYYHYYQRYDATNTIPMFLFNTAIIKGGPRKG